MAWICLVLNELEKADAYSQPGLRRATIRTQLHAPADRMEPRPVFKGKKIKKTNGSDSVTIYGLTGAFRVKNQRYVLTDGRPTDYLSLCGNLTTGAYSKGLGEFIEEWSDDLSYEKMSKLLSHLTGSAVLSSSGIQSYLARKAESISQEWVLQSKTALTEIAVLSDMPLYQAESKEVILMMHDVGVKSQKPHKQVERLSQDVKRLDTTVVLLQDEQQNYHYATQGIDKTGQKGMAWAKPGSSSLAIIKIYRLNNKIAA